ncbi:funZ protein [Sphingomonas sp. ABOLE]|uniref:P-loop ATPase, Sll1717 family n=1 Tax=Sphingomonas sp. ABOLE TaxID=1985878 RepID=UPI000F7DD78D|nr:funZ protein [Sphingomonas sp. ABOLE]RSV39462.1 funZ protein [Sphingomonas sp. ABOLE]
MLPVPEIDFGPIDAVNYRQRDNKNLLSKILYKEHFLDEIVRPSKFFLIGEKGTGKTSYSVYLENNDYENTRARVIELNATDYQKFVALKRAGKLEVSSYTDAWKVILLLLMSDAVEKLVPDNMVWTSKFKAIREATTAYYNDAFKPEVDYSLEMVKDSEAALALMTKFLQASEKDKISEKLSSTNFQISLFSLQKQFEDAIASLSIPKNVILFIDGIDIRPQEIHYNEYIECIRGLANATWQLNSEFFANVKDSKGRLKVCLLMRPDILDQMGFQNLNAKVRDNGVVLNWQTIYDNFSSSPIFHLVNGIITKQQNINEQNADAVWKHYFPYTVQNQRISEKADDPFIGFLRYSFYRPRDIVQYLTLMADYIAQHMADKSHFTEKAFHRCEKDFSEYLLGEVKDYLSFYYGNVDFDQIVGFFSMFEGRNNFSWDQFCAAFEKYRGGLPADEITVEELKGKPKDFLQFLYSLNIIGYLEPEEFGGNFIHWCFRDRTPVKLRPKVKDGLHYTVHPGLARSLLVGRSAGARSTRPARPSKHSKVRPATKLSQRGSGRSQVRSETDRRRPVQAVEKSAPLKPKNDSGTGLSQSKAAIRRRKRRANKRQQAQENREQ